MRNCNWGNSGRLNRFFTAMIIGSLFLFLQIFAPSTSRAEGQEDEGSLDLTEWSLDDLGSFKVRRLDVMGAHTHYKGEWMVAYQTMMMSMEGNRSGTTDLTPSLVLSEGYMVTPVKMTMQMHMLDLMYSPSDYLTFMVMAQWVQVSMDHITSPMMGSKSFTTKSSGIGDIFLSVMIPLYERGNSQFILSPGITIPTGSISNKDVLANVAMGEQKLPYPMQTGSGTVDATPSLTYLWETEDIALGAKAFGTVRFGRNSNGYNLGNRFSLHSWAATRVTDWFSPSLKLLVESWENVNGLDPDLAAGMVPTADPNKRGGKRASLSAGIDLYVLSGIFEDQHFTLEGGMPIYQSLDGPQLKTNWQFTLRISRTFK